MILLNIQIEALGLEATMTDTDKALQFGNEYPYDAPDRWLAYEGETTLPAPHSKDWAHRAARGIIADLKDRRGIKHGFENVDEETRSEIVSSLAAIIRRAEGTHRL